MKANLMNSTIEMTKTEARAAGVLNSDKFNELKELRQMYPAFQIAVRKTAKRNTKKHETYKGLTYEYMKNYITSHNADLMTEFYSKRGMDANAQKKDFDSGDSYGEIKKWFLNNFPELQVNQTEVEKNNKSCLHYNEVA